MLNFDCLQNLISTGKEIEKANISVKDVRFTDWRMKVEKYISDEYGSDSIEMKSFHFLKIQLVSKFFL